MPCGRNVSYEAQGVKSLGGHFVCLCQGFDFYEVKKNVTIFQKEKENTFTLLIIWGTREKNSLFPYKRTAFFSGTLNFFGPSYFEAALVGTSKLSPLCERMESSIL